MERHLYFLVFAFDVHVHAFVLMANHFHLLARFPRQNLSDGMAYFLRETSRELTRTSKRINHTYSSRFFRVSIGNPLYYLHCYKYVYRNPVEAGLAHRTEEYRWSTLRGLLGFERIAIPLAEDNTLFSNVEGTLRWLNQAPEVEDWEAVRKAIRKREFKLGKAANKREPHSLEGKLL